MKTKPQGRPPVPKKLRLDRRVPVVVTETEFQEIKSAADREGVTVSSFGRDALLKAARVSR